MENNKNYSAFCDENAQKNEDNYNQTIVFANQDNQDISEYEKLDSNNYKTDIFSNQDISSNKIQKQNIKFNTTQFSDSTSGNYRKKIKITYGKFIKYPEHDKTDAPKPINEFFIKNKELYNKIYQLFSEDIAHFISLRAIELKTAIIDYGQKRINDRINLDDNNKTIYELRYIDYNKFCKPHSKEFNKRNLRKKLGDLFIEFQDTDNDRFRDQNKEVIKYIIKNINEQLFAFDLIDLTFYELVKKFIDEKRLKNYLEKKDNELKKLYLKNNIINYERRIEAFNEIITTLCNNFEEYSE